MDYTDTMTFLQSLGAPRADAQAILGAPLPAGTRQALDAWGKALMEGYLRSGQTYPPSDEDVTRLSIQTIAAMTYYTVKVRQAAGEINAAAVESLLADIATIAHSDGADDDAIRTAAERIRELISPDYAYRANLEGTAVFNANLRFSAVVTARLFDAACPIEDAEKTIVAAFEPRGAFESAF